ncbi:MAG TPA: sugar hydrolase, partial [Cryomorphaceae bacterium]|nr:sugar hydrolase [Cryomorphaceae bacterium]
MKQLFVGLLAAGALSAAAQSLQDVNVFLGTERMGHTFPGAVVPFGMVQLSPDTRLVPYALPNGSYNPEVYGYCAGYQYEDRTIYGFSHTHFSGTGHSDLGDFSLLPVKAGQSLRPGDGTDPASGYFETFDKETESAEPGYYRVQLERSGVLAELSANTHTGFHRYTYPAEDSAALLLDLVNGIYGYEGKVLWSSLRVENDTLITGYRHVSGWARDRYIYFAASFSRPVQSYRHQKDDQTPYRGFYRRFKEFENFPEMAGRAVRAEFTFAPSEAPLEVVFAISGVSTAGALASLRAEAKPFDVAKAEAQSRWLVELGKIQGEFLTPEDRTTFYAALYHSLIAPHVFQDVDGQYRGLDGN